MSPSQHTISTSWLQNYGFRVVLGTRFGDIFRSNSAKAGLLVGILTEEARNSLWGAIEADPHVETTVDLASQSITRGDLRLSFEIDEYTKHRLLNGLDDISLTLQQEDAISSYEAGRPSFKPKTLPVRTAG